MRRNVKLRSVKVVGVGKAPGKSSRGNASTSSLVKNEKCVCFIAGWWRIATFGDSLMCEQYELRDEAQCVKMARMVEGCYTHGSGSVSRFKGSSPLFQRRVPFPTACGAGS